MEQELRSLTRMSDAAVQAKTGKTWAEWFAVLDAAGAQQMTHQQIVAYLATQYGVPGWWQQMVTVTYEQERGLREKHQQPDGYQISSSKTISVPVARLFAAWEEAEQRSRWLAESSLQIRKVTPHKSLRASWGEGDSRLDVNFYARGATKSQVTLQHSRLADAETAERMKAFWATRLEELKALLED